MLRITFLGETGTAESEKYYGHTATDCEEDLLKQMNAYAIP